MVNIQKFNKILKIKYVKNILICLILIFISIFFSVFYFYVGVYKQDDLWFHLSRFAQIQNYFTTPINFKYFASHGQVMNLFYPSLIIYVFKFIFNITNNFIFSYKLFTYFVILICTITSFLLGKLITKKTLGGLLFVVTYVFSNYFFILIYIRYSLGEFLGYSFLPLVIFGLVKILQKEYKYFWIFSIALTFISYSHVLSILFSLFLTFIIIYIIRKKVSLQTWKYLIYSFILWFVLSSASIVVLFIELSHNDINVPGLYNKLSEQTKPIYQLLWVALKNEIIFSNVNEKMLTIHHSYNFGILPIFAFIVYFIKKTKNTLDLKISFWILVFSIIIQSNLTPWFLIEKIQLFNVFQFLFRFNFLTAITTSYLLSKKLCLITDKKIYFFSLNMFIVILFLININISNKHLFNQNFSDNYKNINNENLLKDLKTYSHSDYRNKIKNIVKTPEFKNNNIIIDSKEENISKFETKISSQVYEIKIKNDKNRVVNVVMPISVYQGTTLKINDKIVKPMLSTKYGSLEFKIPPNLISTIKISYSWTLLSKVAQIISLISWIILLIYLIFQKVKTWVKFA